MQGQRPTQASASSGNHLQWQWKRPWKSMGNPWEIHGKSRGNPWESSESIWFSMIHSCISRIFIGLKQRRCLFFPQFPLKFILRVVLCSTWLQSVLPNETVPLTWHPLSDVPILVPWIPIVTERFFGTPSSFPIQTCVLQYIYKDIHIIYIYSI